MEEGTTTPELDVAAAGASGKIRLAAAICVVAGLLVALTGAQLLGLRFVIAALNAAPWGFIVLGVALAATGPALYRIKPWAPLAALVSSISGAAATLGWAVYAVPGGLVSCVGLLAPLACGGAIVAVLGARGDARRAAEVRERLAAEGMDLGF